MSELPSVVDLLSNDYSGTGLKTITEELLTTQQRLHHMLDQGLSPDEFAKAKQVLEGIQTALDVAPKLHEKLA